MFAIRQRSNKARAAFCHRSVPRAARASSRLPAVLELSAPPLQSPRWYASSAATSSPAVSRTANLQQDLSDWNELLATPLTLDDVRRRAADVAQRSLDDMGVTLEQQAAAWGPHVTSVLQRPIPCDGSMPALELLEPAGTKKGLFDFHGPSPLYKSVWRHMEMSVSTTDRTLVLLTGAPGSGKSKVAVDIGRKCNTIMVICRVAEEDADGERKLTPPWQLLESVICKLQAQAKSAKAARAAREDLRSVYQYPDREMDAALACVRLLLSCNLEWALTVYDEAARAVAARKGGPVTLEDRGALLEAVMRAQRSDGSSGWHECVRALFALRLREMLPAPGKTSLVWDPLRKLIESKPPHAPSVSWCYDEVQALLDHHAFDGFLVAPWQSARTSAANTTSSSGAGSSGAPDEPFIFEPAESWHRTSLPPHLVGLTEDVEVHGRTRGRRTQGFFFGLAWAVSDGLRDHPGGGHLLCASHPRLYDEVRPEHNAATRAPSITEADVLLDVPALRAWLGAYLTPAAMEGLDDELLGQLKGRPMFAAGVFKELHASLSALKPSQEASVAATDPGAVARAAVQRAIEIATAQACTRVDKLWTSTFNTAKGPRPQSLPAWLYYAQRMGSGPKVHVAPVWSSAESLAAWQSGMLHADGGGTALDFRDEPITAAAILRVGDTRTASVKGDDDDDDVIMTRALTRPQQPSMLDDLFAWKLLKRALSFGGPVPLQTLLEPFVQPLSLAGSPPIAFPSSLAGHTVHLESGLDYNIAAPKSWEPAGYASTIFEFLARPGGDKLLLHRARTDEAKVDIAFLAQRPGATPDSPPRQRLVLVHVSNPTGKGDIDIDMSEMLRSLNLGDWYRSHYHTPTGEEAPRYAAMRRVIEKNPDWADPIRVLVSARPYAENALQAAACVNAAMVPSQPVLLARVGKDNVGVDIAGAGGKAIGPPKYSSAWFPTRLRHWPVGVPHPQDGMLPLEGPNLREARDFRLSRRVRFSISVDGGVASSSSAASSAPISISGLQAVAGRLGANTVIKTTRKAVTVEFSALSAALQAVTEAGMGSLLVGGSPVSAAFVHEPASSKRGSATDTRKSEKL